MCRLLMYYNKLFTYLLLSDAEVGKDVTKNIVVGDYAYDFGEVIDCDAQAQVYLPYFTNQYPSATNNSPAMRLAAT